MNDSCLGEISTLCNLLAEAGGARPPSVRRTLTAAHVWTCESSRSLSSRSARPSNDPFACCETCEAAPAAWRTVTTSVGLLDLSLRSPVTCRADSTQRVRSRYFKSVLTLAVSRKKKQKKTLNATGRNGKKKPISCLQRGWSTLLVQ